MKKAIAILLIALFVITLCAGLGCAKKEQPKEAPTTEETAPVPAPETAPTDTAAAGTGTTGGQ
jgi:flagellar basal body-associated protein FliL